MQPASSSHPLKHFWVFSPRVCLEVPQGTRNPSTQLFEKKEKWGDNYCQHDLEMPNRAWERERWVSALVEIPASESSPDACWSKSWKCIQLFSYRQHHQGAGCYGSSGRNLLAPLGGEAPGFKPISIRMEVKDSSSRPCFTMTFQICELQWSSCICTCYLLLFCIVIFVFILYCYYLLFLLFSLPTLLQRENKVCSEDFCGLQHSSNTRWFYGNGNAKDNRNYFWRTATSVMLPKPSYVRSVSSVSRMVKYVNEWIERSCKLPLHSVSIESQRLLP